MTRPSDPEPRAPRAAKRPPAMLTLTVFYPSGSCSPEDAASGAAQLRAARVLLMRLMREHALLRHARSAGVRLRFDPPELADALPLGRFDHAVGRLEAHVARGVSGRFEARFYRGVDETCRVSIGVRPQEPRPGAR